MSLKSASLVFVIVYVISMSITIYFLYEFNANESTYFGILNSIKLNQRSVLKCFNRIRETSIEHNGDYLVYLNIIPSRLTFKCFESVTLATIADVTFLDNLLPLVKRWRGPISLAIYAPGQDLQLALDSIAYLRHCEGLIKELVSFHIFHEHTHTPQGMEGGILNHLQRYSTKLKTVNCSIPPFLNYQLNETYRKINKLPFAINVARNIARKGVQTHYFLSSDIELYPSLHVITRFLNMVFNTPQIQLQWNKAFVLPVFEVNQNVNIPEHKRELQGLFFDKKAIFFHENICPNCHAVPEKMRWIETDASDSNKLKEFTQSKRQEQFKHWEPFFIGTHFDPTHDERIYWEGAGDKMVQAYAQCLLDYDFIVLDNAFLVHKAGIKLKSEQTEADRAAMKEIMEYVVKPELDALYGYREGCSMV